MLQAEAFTTALERFCAADEPDRWQLLATYGARGLRQMLVEVYATLRSAGRELVLEPGTARAAGRAARSPPRGVPAAPRRPGGDRGAARGRIARARRPRCVRPARAASRSLGDEGARASRGRVRRGARRGGRGGARGPRRTRPRAPPGAPDDVRRRRTRSRRSASPRSTSRISSCARATCCATTRRSASASGSASARSWWTSSRTRIASRPSCSTCSARERTATSSSSATSSSRSTASATPTSPCSASGATAAPTVLPLTRNHRSRPEVLAAVNELFGAEFGDEFQRLEPADDAAPTALRNAVRAARDGQGGGGGDRRALAPLRGPPRRATGPRARRRR